jgi:hypothetical protein
MFSDICSVIEFATLDVNEHRGYSGKSTENNIKKFGEELLAYFSLIWDEPHRTQKISEGDTDSKVIP